MAEEWQDIPNYEGLYQVSNLGRVKSLSKLCGKSPRKDKILKPEISKDGYLRVNLCKNGKVKKFQIHRLVAQAFIENALNKPFINHLDCDRQNNCINNLEWCTAKENMQYASKLGRLKNGFKNVSAEQRRINGKKAGCKPVIATNLKTNEQTYFESIREAARKLNISQGNISTVLKSKIKQTNNYTFREVI